jgi:hypothetical protein
MMIKQDLRVAPLKTFGPVPFTDGMDAKLREVREWAEGKIAQCQEPPWAQKRYQDLIALLDEILASRAATISLEDSLRLQAHQVPDLPRSDRIRHISDARSRRGRPLKIRLPM